MKTAAIIQARMGSTRLPGKVMLTVCGQTILGHVVNRVKQAALPDIVLVATTTAAADDVIVEECRRLRTAFFRGSETDVLGRYHGAASSVGADIIVRITSDCPLYDPHLLDLMLSDFFQGFSQQGSKLDYLSNTLKRTFPRGLDTEIFTFAALDRAQCEASLPSEREHVTPYIYHHPELFNLRSYEGPADYSHYRWTLDTPEDWEFVKAVYERLGHGGRWFDTREVFELLEREPALAQINAHVQQKQV